MELKQDDEYKGKDWWKWSIWVEGDDAELDSIAEVEYTLHPTFPNPVRTETDRAAKFKLRSSGWGTFTIYAKIKKRDGDEIDLEHELRLNYPDDAGAVSRGAPTDVSDKPTAGPRKPSSRDDSSDSLIEKRIEQSLNKPKFEWRTLRRVAIEAGISEVEAADKLRAKDDVRFGRGKKGETIVGLKERVGDTH